MKGSEKGGEEKRKKKIKKKEIVVVVDYDRHRLKYITKRDRDVERELNKKKKERKKVLQNGVHDRRATSDIPYVDSVIL